MRLFRRVASVLLVMSLLVSELGTGTAMAAPVINDAVTQRIQTSQLVETSIFEDSFEDDLSQWTIVGDVAFTDDEVAVGLQATKMVGTASLEKNFSDNHENVHLLFYAKTNFVAEDDLLSVEQKISGNWVQINQIETDGAFKIYDVPLIGIADETTSIRFSLKGSESTYVLIDDVTLGSMSITPESFTYQENPLNDEISRMMYENQDPYSNNLNLITTTGSAVIGETTDPEEITQTTSSAIVAEYNQIDSYYSHTIALKEDGTVWSWGSNSNGQLGNSSLEYNPTPTEVDVLDKCIEVAVGGNHSLALQEDGTVWAWGANDSGQLGNGTNDDSTVPTMVSQLTDIVKIAAGDKHSIAIRLDGKVFAWGQNSDGQLGDGTRDDSNIPVEVTGLANVIDIDGGDNHTLALLEDGTLMGFGGNWYGQLGDTSFSDRVLTPQVITTISDVVSIQTGYMTSAVVRDDGTVWTCGWNSNNQLGNRTITDEETFGMVMDIADAVYAGIGLSFGVVLKEDGTLMSWGDSINGQLGDGTNISKTNPTELITISNVSQLNVAYNHSNIIKNDGTIWGFGKGDYGVIGDGSESDRYVPTEATVMHPTNSPTRPGILSGMAIEIGVGLSWTSGEQAYSYNIYRSQTKGENYQLIAENIESNSYIDTSTGNGAYYYKVQSVNDIYTSDFSNEIGVYVTYGGYAVSMYAEMKVDTTAYTNVFLKNDGTVWTSGMNDYGQLGIGETSSHVSEPVQVVGLTGIVDVAAGYNHILALDMEGQVWAWGRDAYGALGTPGIDDCYIPTQVAGLKDVRMIATGYHHSMAVTSDGTVWAWGLGGNGQLGNNLWTNMEVPVRVGTFEDVTFIEAGSRHSFIGTADGTLYAFGRNTDGELGIGSTMNQNEAIEVTGISNVVDLSAGEWSTYAVTSDGQVWTWGIAETENQQIKLQTDYRSTTDTTVPGSLSNISDVVDIDEGVYHVVALHEDGTVSGWGQNTFGQLTYQDQLERDTVTALSGLTGIEQIFAGRLHNLALTDDGHLVGWGHSGSGQLGGWYPDNRVYTPVTFEHIRNYGVPGIVTNIEVDITIDSVELNWEATQYADTYKVLRSVGDNTSYEVIAGNLQETSYIDSEVLLNEQYYYIIIGDNAYTQGDYSEEVFVDMQFDIFNGTAIDADKYYYHTVALKEDGTVWTWGRNDEGQLGNDTEEYNPTPTMVEGLSEIVDVAAGKYHCLALKHDGTVWAWGGNTDGQLGDGTNERSITPVQVLGLSDVVMVEAGKETSYAVLEDGTVWAWGQNDSGELGNGNSTSANIPQEVLGVVNPIAIDGGECHSAAIMQDGSLMVWGNNWHGQLGLGDSTRSEKTPIENPNITGVTSFSLGYYVTGLTTDDGSVWTFGWSNGQLGIRDTEDNRVPGKLVGSSDAIGVTLGVSYGLYTTTDGDVYIWGSGGVGQTGTGDKYTYDNPIKNVALMNVQRVITGHYGVLTIKNDGSIWYMGAGKYGQPGQGNTYSTYSPVEIGEMRHINSPECPRILQGEVEENQVVLSWDASLNAESYRIYRSIGTSDNMILITDNITGTTYIDETISDGDYYYTIEAINENLISAQSNLIRINKADTDFETAIMIDTYAYHNIAVLEDGTVWTWGDNEYGQLGNGTVGGDSPVPTQVSGLNHCIGVAAGYYHTLALTEEGNVYVWGRNNYGQLGLSHNNDVCEPQMVPGLENIVTIAAGHSFTFAIDINGNVWAFGKNGDYQLGNDCYGNTNIPTRVKNITDVVKIDAGTAHTLAQTSDGTFYAWGNNHLGELGIGTTSDRRLPDIVPGITGVVAFEAGTYCSYVVLEDGSLWSCGYDPYPNGHNKLGDRSTTDTTVFGQVVGVSNAVDVDEGKHHMIALLSDGTLVGIGENTYGQLGYEDLENKSEIVGVTNYSNIKSISIGRRHNVAILTDGSIVTWGLNYNYAIMDSTLSYVIIPIQISQLTTLKKPIAITDLDMTYSENIVNLTWTQSPYSSTYMILRSEGNEDNFIVLADNISTSNYSDYITIEEDYYYKVIAINDSYTSDDSNIIYVDGIAPSIPDGISGIYVSSSESVELSWLNSSDNCSEVSYQIYRDGSMIGSSTENRYSDENIEFDMLYQYNVIAIDNYGNTSVMSQTAEVSTTNIIQKPVLNIEKVSTTYFTLNWEPIEEATSYQIKVDDVIYNTTETSIIINNLNRGLTYRVSAQTTIDTLSSGYTDSINIRTNIVTVIDGNIISDTSLTLEDSPYKVVGVVVIQPEVTMIIEEDVEIRFDSRTISNTYFNLFNVYGNLVIRGTIYKPNIIRLPFYSVPKPDDDSTIYGWEFIELHPSGTILNGIYLIDGEA